MTRLGWIGKTEVLALARQCVLAGVARASVYAQQKTKLRIGAGMQDDEALKRLIDEEYTRHPFFGSRKMVVYLKRCEHHVNRKRVQRLMRSMGLAGMAPGPHTSKAHPQHKAYPYLLRGVLQREGITISMDGRGRAVDNIFVERLWRSVKHEDVYLKGYAAMGELQVGLRQYFAFYNGERMHQSLGNQTPDAVYASGSGGGALIVDKYLRAEEKPGQRCSAASQTECNLN